MAMLGNTPYVAARAKSRRQKLADRARLRQLINQSPEQMTVAVGDMGYRAEMDLYAGKYSGGDLVEAALTHNLELSLIHTDSADDLLCLYLGCSRLIQQKK